MCKVHKLSDTNEAGANPCIFKSFSNTLEEKSRHEQSSNQEFDEYCKRIKALEQEILLLQRKADSIISDAQMEAEKIIEKANHEAVAVLNSSSVEGYKKGLSLANEKINGVIITTKLKADKIIENTTRNSDKIIHILEGEALNISLDIAKKILDVELDRNDGTIISIIKKTLSKLKTDTASKIIMSADDMAVLEAMGIDEVFPKQANLKFSVDSGLKKGDLIIENEKGFIDAGVGSQFSRLQSALAVHEKIAAV